MPPVRSPKSVLTALIAIVGATIVAGYLAWKIGARPMVIAPLAVWVAVTSVYIIEIRRIKRDRME